MPVDLSANGEPPRAPVTMVAPVWHTVTVLVILAGISALTLHSQTSHPTATEHQRVVAYFSTIAFEWLLVGFIALSARWGGAPLRVLAGGFAPSWSSIFRDFGIAIAYLFVSQIVLGTLNVLLHHFMHSNANAVLKNLLPHTGLEIAVYLVLCVTAGICEEAIFRGYLQHQFTAWTGSAAIGIALQGAIFGAGHTYQGPLMMIVIGVYGCMFGMLAWWRKSLRPGMTAHCLQDALAGIVLAKFLPK
jgi:uncharacterized protein